jgi:hypothetical protein
MRRIPGLAAAAALTLTGCVGTGSGWSRAPDLSVYASARAYARVAWEQDVYCEGATPAAASASFARAYGGRDAAVRAALAERHGEAALARAGRHFVQRVPCRDVPDPQWRERYGRLLRLLEIRLGLG